ncbi:hypothetical protein F4679DRAFT_580018 [Xylaria curta]|nr:hypothetical protein F4679DRAFT_580018 [Xylaria curta]
MSLGDPGPRPKPGPTWSTLSVAWTAIGRSAGTLGDPTGATGAHWEVDGPIGQSAAGRVQEREAASPETSQTRRLTPHAMMSWHRRWILNQDGPEPGKPGTVYGVPALDGAASPAARFLLPPGHLRRDRRACTTSTTKHHQAPPVAHGRISRLQ